MTAAPDLRLWSAVRRILAWLGPMFVTLGVVATSHAQMAAPTAPTVVLEAVAGRDTVERQEAVDVFVMVANRSDAVLSGFKLTLPNSAFKVDAAAFPVSLPAFATTQQTLTVRASADAVFGQHKVPIVLEYTWRLGDADVRSAQTAVVPLQVRRRFEEEAKGLPGGTAAILYLLLPVIPAFLSYETIERLRRGEGLQVPTFRNEHIAFAFLIALVLSFLMVTAAHWDVAVAYSDPLVFVTVLGISAVVGAVVPSLRWGWGQYLMWQWGFKEEDTGPSYLRKALLGRVGPPDFNWVIGAVNGDAWEGVLLEQPNGTTVLGARLLVSPAGADEPARDAVWATLTGEIFTGTTLNDRHRLLEMVDAGRVIVNFREKILHGVVRLDTVVVENVPAALTQEPRQRKPLVEPVR